MTWDSRSTGGRARGGSDRDRVGEGLPDPPRLVRVRRRCGRAGARGRGGGGRAAVPGLRGAPPGPAADRLRVGARADGGDPAHRAVVAREVHSAFRYFTVDEFQDVNPLQKLLLDAWLGGREELCVVGDPQQTIYSFTGATSEYLRGFAADFPSATVVRLVRDYRSTPQVVAAANRLTAGGGAGALAAAESSGALVAQRPAGPDPVLTRYPDDEAEAAGRRRRGGGADQAIRAGQRDRHPAADQRARGAVRAGAGGRRRAVRGARGRAVLQPPRGPPGAGAASAAPPTPRGPAPTRPGCRGSCPPPSATCSRRPGSPRCRPPPAARSGSAGNRWRRSPGWPTTWPRRGRGRRWRSSPPSSPSARTPGTLPVAAAVTLATMHAAKGLEWDAVLIPGLVEGIMPIVHARTAEAIEEERRLLYVAVTRARVRLALSWAPARTPGAEAARQRSRFLAALFPTAATAVPGRRSS